MIRIEKLEKKFGKLHVLKGVDALFEQGQVISVIETKLVICPKLAGIRRI